MTALRRALRSLVVAGLVACAGLVVPSPAAAVDSCDDSEGASLLIKNFTSSGVLTTCLDWAALSHSQDVPASNYIYKVNAESEPVEDSNTMPGGTSANEALRLANVLPSQVLTAAIRRPGGTPSRLTSQTSDFVEKQDWHDTWLGGPPVFYTTNNGDSITYRRAQHADNADDVTGGEVGSGDGGQLIFSVHTNVRVLLHPQLVGPMSTPADKSAEYTVTVDDDQDDTDVLTADFTFSDDPQPEGGRIERDGTLTVSHTFPAATFTKHYRVRVEVTSEVSVSGGEASLDVTVPGKKPPPPTTPPATSGLSNGAGGANAPVYAPPTGSGPGPTGTTSAPANARGKTDTGVADRSGPTGRTTGRAGAAGRATTSGGALPAGVRVAGYALQAPGVVEQEYGGRRPAAPAARSSVTHTAFPTWGVVAALVVIGLGLVGAVSERRRPSRGPRRAVR